MFMRFASSIASSSDPEEAIERLLEPIDTRVTPGMVDLALLFVTGHFEDDLPEVIERISARLPTAVIFGCTVEGTIGVDQELERTPSMSLLAASLPDVSIRPFYLKQGELENAVDNHDWERIVAVAPESQPIFVALADPFRFAVHEFVEQINDVFPGAPLVGGVASAGQEPGQNRLILNHDIYQEGLVGVALTGRLAVDTVVSQGCRPIGKPFIITKGDRNIILELGGKPALEQLHNILVNLSPEEEQLARQSLFVGSVIDEFKETFQRGDFLIYNIIGVDQKRGAMGIAGPARTGATVQFHVRDADSADEDLRSMLIPHQDRDVKGAMLFGCNGRGTRMWSTPGHDIGVFRERMGDVPIAGAFCGGEFGPVGGKNFVHGFTASIALFRDPDNT